MEIRFITITHLNMHVWYDSDQHFYEAYHIGQQTDFTTAETKRMQLSGLSNMWTLRHRWCEANNEEGTA
jgi:hypothetical protein